VFFSRQDALSDWRCDRPVIGREFRDSRPWCQGELWAVRRYEL